MADQVLNASLRLNLDEARLEAQLRRLESRLAKVSRAGGGGSGGGRPLGKIDSNFSEFDKSLDAATARVIAFTGTTGIIYGVGAAFRRITRDFIAVESALAGIQSITKSTKEQMKALSSEAFGLANSLGVGFEDVASGIQEFARQGLNAEKSIKATAGALSIAKLSGTDLKQAIDGLVATTNSFTGELLEYGEVANSLVSIDQKFATSAGGLIEGIKRVGSVASEAGVRFAELAGTIASVRQVSGRSESIIGNSLKTIFTNLQTDRVQKELTSLGITTKDAAGDFKPLIEVLTELSDVYDKLSDSRKADLGQKIAGKYQINQFKALVTSFQGGDASLFKRAVTAADDPTDEVQARLDIINKTTEASLKRLDNNFTKFGASIGEKVAKPVIDTLAASANNIISGLDFVFNETGPIGKTISEGIAGAISGPGVILAIAAIGKLAFRIAGEFGQAVASVAGLNKQMGNLVNENRLVTQELIKQNSVRQAAIAQTTQLAVATAAVAAASRKNNPGIPGVPDRSFIRSPYDRAIQNSKRNPNALPPNFQMTLWERGSNLTPQQANLERLKKQRAEYIAQERKRRSIDFDPFAGVAIPANKYERSAGIKPGDAAALAAFRAADGETQRQAINDAKKEARRRRAGAIGGASIAAPFVASGIANGFLGGRKTSAGRLTEDISNAGATGLALTAIAGGGPAAIAAGAAIGGVGILDAINKEKYNPQDQIEKFEALQAQFTERQNTIQAYVEALNNIGDLKSSGASLGKIQRAREQSDKLLSALAGTDADAIAGLAGNTEAIANYLSNLSETQGRRTALSGLSKNVAETSASYNDSFFGSRKNLESKDLDVFARALVGSIDTSNISASRLRDLGSRGGDLTSGDLKGLGLDAEEVNKIFETLSEGFENGERDFSSAVKKLLLSSSRFKELAKAASSLENARISVEANINKLAKAYSQRSNLENTGRQAEFGRNISSVRNNLEFQSSQGFITEEVNAQVEFETSLLELQNKFNQDTRKILEDVSDAVLESSSKINSDADRAKALELLPAANRGDVSPLDLAKSFEEIANSFKETSDSKRVSEEFTDSMNRIVLAGEAVRVEFEAQEKTIRESYQLERARISNAKLSSYNGGQLNPKDFLELLSKTLGSSSVPFGSNSQDRAASAQANYNRLKAEKDLGLGFSGFADSDLTEEERASKRKEEQARREQGLQFQRDILGERDRITNETRARDEIAKINKAVPGGISDEKQKEIIAAINSGDPAGALRALDKVTRRGLPTSQTVTRVDGSVRTFSLEDERTRRVREAASGLSGQLGSAEVARREEERRAELISKRDFPSSQAPEEIAKAQQAAEEASKNKEVSVFVEALNKSSHIQKLSSLDASVGLILDRLTVAQSASKLAKDLEAGRLSQSSIQKEIDELNPKPFTRFRDTGGALVDPLLEAATGDNYTKSGRNVFDTDSGEMSGEDASRRIRNLKTRLRRIDFNKLNDEEDSEAAQSEVSKSGLSGAQGRLAAAIEKLVELEKKRQALEERNKVREEELRDAKTTDSNANVSLEVKVSASDILTKVVEGGAFETQIAQFVTDQFIKVYTEVNGVRPALKPETALA